MGHTIRRHFLAALAGSHPRFSHAAAPPELDQLRKHGIPGAQFHVSLPATPPVSRALGLASQSPQREMLPATRFEAASLSKPVFACAVLLLCERGQLALDSALGDLLPAGALPRDPQFARIQVRHILTHSSGIEPEPPKERESRQLFPSGTRFTYSPHAFDFLQRAVETLTGQPLPDLMHTLVLGPLHMSSSTFSWRDFLTRDRAIGHAAEGTPAPTINERVELMTPVSRARLATQYPRMNFPNAASSLITTAADYARFLDALARPTPTGLFSAKFTQLLAEPLIPAGAGIDWGLAFGVVSKTALGPVLWQWGDSGVFQHFCAFAPSSGSTLVSLTNGARGQRFNRDLCAASFNAALPCFRWLRV